MKLNVFTSSKSSLQKRISAMAFPLLLSYVMNFIYTLGDQAIIGRTSMTEYAAVSVVSNLLYALTGTFGIVALTLNILGSKMIGQGKLDDYRDLFNTIMTFVITLGSIIAGFNLLFGRLCLATVFHMSGAMLNHAYVYLSIAGFGLGLNMILFIFSSFFKSIEKTKVILTATIVSSMLNLIIDYVLVFGKLGFPRLGVIGAALGTTLGLLTNVVIYTIYFRKVSDFSFSFGVSKRFLKPVTASYIPLLGQDFVESTAFTIGLTMLITRLDADNIAVYGIIATLISCITLPIYAYSNVAMTLVSKANGARSMDLLKILPRLILKQILGIVFLVSLFMLCSKSYLPMLITNNKLLVDATSTVIGFAIIIQIFNVFNQVYRYMLNALEDEKWVFYFSSVTSILSLLVIFLMLATTEMNLIAIYIGLGLNHLINGIGFAIRYRQLYSLHVLKALR